MPIERSGCFYNFRHRVIEPSITQINTLESTIKGNVYGVGIVDYH